MYIGHAFNAKLQIFQNVKLFLISLKIIIEIYLLTLCYNHEWNQKKYFLSCFN